MKRRFIVRYEEALALAQRLRCGLYRALEVTYHPKYLKTFNRYSNNSSTWFVLTVE